MRNVFVRVILVAVAAAGGAFAQNSEIGLLFGASVGVNEVSGNGITNQAGGSFQLSYAAQLHEAATGRLYFELPLLIGGVGSNRVAAGVVSNSVDYQIFLTPGVRWRFSPASRVAFYAMAGGGLGYLGRAQNLVAPGRISNSDRGTATPALAFGGGLDFRLTRLLSLKLEGRDGVTRGNIDGAVHHTLIQFGLGFHF